VIGGRELALRNLRALGQSLREHVREVVDDVESDAMLALLLRQHEHAEQMFDALGVPPK
jgi:hypothetical protein